MVMKLSKCTVLILATCCTSTLAQADEMLRNGDFGSKLDGWWTTGGTAVIENQDACIDIKNPGANPWNVILGQAGIGLENGEDYSISFSAYADVETQMKTLIQHEGPPYTHYFLADTLLTPTKQTFEYNFKHELESDAGGEFQFQMGAQESTKVCVNDISIKGKPYIEKLSISNIRTNQVGFYPKADKTVFVASDSDQPLRWTLQNAQGINIDLGRTQIYGINDASGEHLHHIDLSSIQSEVSNLTIHIDGDKSFPINVKANIYQDLKHDSFSYFYQNRSGIEILPEFVQRPDLARPAGHVKDTVTCFDKMDAWGNKWPGCDLTIDTTGGWYDAGDHGKYTVNSGISTWTLLNLYERGVHLEEAKVPFSGENVQIPEAATSINPVLSEARWNVEFMLSMQIPPGSQVSVPVGDQSHTKKLKLTPIDASGLAFHKIADEAWTGIPLPPHKDTQTRYVGQPSTAATLNVAAIGAQCARIWKELDADFSKQCLDAATTAWNAALKHPEIYAYDNFTGSGPYDDLSLSDEFYWAAAELFISTGDEQYLTVVKESKHFLETPTANNKTDGDIFWQYTAPLGTLSLAVVPNNLDESNKQLAKQNIVLTASKYQDQVTKQGYQIPYFVEEYPWGSNSNLVNRGIFLIYANDFTGELEYLKTAAKSLDYLLGSNPMNISYVTGYGTNYAQNPHHRFWAKAADSNAPSPAPGALIGGPNSTSFSDPIAATLKGKCIGQTCYRDNIGAWSLNEITINWNAPLFWVVSAIEEGKLN